ncbi:MAG: hypothetical protein IJW30_02900 [Clostridia bacterium]|nr:hypothetical protein [Clostridia bacterium]
MQESTYHGYRRVDFTFQNREAIIVFPKDENKTDKWMLKTEYFDAFPELEIAMLGRGYHLVYLKNINRWGIDEDARAKRDLSEYLQSVYGLRRRCVCIGMSCGGWHAVSFASLYPSYVSFLYLDAPLLSFFGLCEPYLTDWIEEHKRARGYQTSGERFVDNNLPIHRLPVLTENRLPVALVYGGVDKVVDPRFNAEALLEYYQLREVPIKVWYKPECDHHPHVAVNLEEVMDYIEAQEI